MSPQYPIDDCCTTVLFCLSLRCPQQYGFRAHQLEGLSGAGEREKEGERERESQDSTAASEHLMLCRPVYFPASQLLYVWFPPLSPCFLRHSGRPANWSGRLWSLGKVPNKQWASNTDQHLSSFFQYPTKTVLLVWLWVSAKERNGQCRSVLAYIHIGDSSRCIHGTS